LCVEGLLGLQPLRRLANSNTAAESGTDGSCYIPLAACSVSDDIGVPLASLQLLSERNVPAFVPRLSVNKGMLPVKLKLSGTDGLPGSAAIQVRRSCVIQAHADQSQVGSALDVVVTCPL
jgi:hypothetical protein